MAFQQPKQYELSVAQSDVPASMLPSRAVRPVNMMQRLVQVPAQNGAQTAGGVLSFLLNNAGNYIKNGSVYLRLKIQPDAAARGNADGTSTWSGAGPTSGLSSIINRCTIFVNGVVAEQINNYHIVHEKLICHASAAPYITNDLKLYEGAGVTYAAAAGVRPVAAEVCIPLLSGLLTCGHDFPLFLAGSGMQINFDLNALATALATQGSAYATAITNYDVTNAYLCYEELQPDAAMVAAMKGQMAAKPFSIPFVSYRTFQSAPTAAFSQPLGLNMSSLRGLLWTHWVKADLAAEGVLADNTQSVARVFLDGRLINSYNLDAQTCPAQSFIEMNRVWNKPQDNSVTSYPSITAATYLSTYFLGGVSATKTHLAGFSFCGQPVNQALIELTLGATNGQTFLTAVYDCVLVMDGVGNVSLVQ